MQVAFSPNHEFLAAVCGKSILLFHRVVDRPRAASSERGEQGSTWEKCATFEHLRWMWSVAFSPATHDDGTCLMAEGGDDGHLVVRRIGMKPRTQGTAAAASSRQLTSTVVHDLLHPSRVQGCDFSADGKLLANCTREGKLLLRAMPGGDVLYWAP